MQKQILLIKDVKHLGRSGDLVRVRPGYSRNYLIPFGYAVHASPRTLRLREKLKADRALREKLDREESEKLKIALEPLTFEFEVKVDELGNLYGSVSNTDIHDMLKEHGFSVEKVMIKLPHALKVLGMHKVELQLKEGVEAILHVRVKNDAFEAFKLEQQREAEHLIVDAPSH